NLANPEMHYRSTGLEIWRQTEGRISAFVAGVGTGGTISGVARYLKEQNPDIRIVGADPQGSLLSRGTPEAWEGESIGEDFVPKTFNSQLVDEWIRVSDAEAFHVAREVARKEGIMLGGSSGVSIAAALKYGQRLGPDQVIVALGADTGRNYLSKFYDEAWLAQNNLIQAPPATQRLADLLKARGARQLFTIGPDATADIAINLMEEQGISQLTVLADGKAVGSIHEVTLARILHDGRDPVQMTVGEIMARPLPALDVMVNLDEAYRLLLAGNTGVLATSSGNIVD